MTKAINCYKLSTIQLQYSLYKARTDKVVFTVINVRFNCLGEDFQYIIISRNRTNDSKHSCTWLHTDVNYTTDEQYNCFSVRFIRGKNKSCKDKIHIHREVQPPVSAIHTQPQRSWQKLFQLSYPSLSLSQSTPKTEQAARGPGYTRCTRREQNSGAQRGLRGVFLGPV